MNLLLKPCKDSVQVGACVINQCYRKQKLKASGLCGSVNTIFLLSVFLKFFFQGERGQQGLPGKQGPPGPKVRSC